MKICWNPRGAAGSAVMHVSRENLPDPVYNMTKPIWSLWRRSSWCDSGWERKALFSWVVRRSLVTECERAVTSCAWLWKAFSTPKPKCCEERSSRWAAELWQLHGTDVLAGVCPGGRVGLFTQVHPFWVSIMAISLSNERLSLWGWARLYFSLTPVSSFPPLSESFQVKESHIFTLFSWSILFLSACLLFCLFISATRCLRPLDSTFSKLINLLFGTAANNYFSNRLFW